MIAGEMSAAYDDIVTMSLVSISGVYCREMRYLTAKKTWKAKLRFNEFSFGFKVYICKYFSW